MFFVMLGVTAVMNAAGEESAVYAPPADPVRGELSIAGSGVMEEFVRRTSTEFMHLCTGVTTWVQFPSSAAVAPMMLREEINLGATTRPLEPDEIAALEKKFGHAPLEIKVAADAIEVLVNANNPINGLTLAQLDAIFSAARRTGAAADITTWGQLGLKGEWVNTRIELFGGGVGWGTTRTFQKIVLLDGEFKDSVKAVEVVTGLAEEVSTRTGAIGYTGLHKRDVPVRAVPLARKEGESYVASTPENILSGKYPIQRFYHFYINAAPSHPIEPAVREYLLYLLSKQGQAAAEATGVLPLSAAVAAQERTKIAR